MELAFRHLQLQLTKPLRTGREREEIQSTVMGVILIWTETSPNFKIYNRGPQ
jgi:hypothetical protein